MEMNDIKNSTRCCEDKLPAGSECLLTLGGFMCQSGVCAERFFWWQVIFWPIALTSKLSLPLSYMP